MADTNEQDPKIQAVIKKLQEKANKIASTQKDLETKSTKDLETLKKQPK